MVVLRKYLIAEERTSDGRTANRGSSHTRIQLGVTDRPEHDSTWMTPCFWIVLEGAVRRTDPKTLS